MIAPKCWAPPQSQIPDEGLGFSVGRHLDPRRHLKRLRKLSDPRKHLAFAKKSLDPRTGLKLGRRGLDPAGLFKKRHGKRKGFLIAQLRARGGLPGSNTRPVTMAVSSPEAAIALGDLGFKLKVPHIGRKLRKKIFKVAAIAAATYFTGGAALAALKAKPGLVGGLIKKVAGGVKAVAPIAKSVIQAKALPALPDSVQAMNAGAAGIPYGGAPGTEYPPFYGQMPGQATYGQAPAGSGGGYTPLPQTYDAESGEVEAGISSTPSQAGFGGLPPALILGGLAVGAFMLLGGGGGRRR
jgi:hypothetical protein